MTNAIRFTRLDRHTIEAPGEVPVSIVVTLFCARNEAGQWFIGNIYVDEVVSWFHPKQGDEVLLSTDKQVQHFVKGWYGTIDGHRTESQRARFAVLCGYLDAAETAQRERGEVLEIH